MGSRLSIYHPSGQVSLGAHPFGKDVANLQLFQALARHGGFEQVDILSARQPSAEDLRDLGGEGNTTRLGWAPLLGAAAPSASGALLRGQPYISELAWLRRRGGARVWARPSRL